ncbi:hypothetical protein SS50377_22331 [Spironucleus salmonicida]|uniref:Uncharacterized protein n=1 Tax=Spironucleus salmonicida TaxID=348837 RepID=V6LCH6_9EUKA|nr:hypothetical protein SS50377_22331 [Spironucleus salmonicida]|eukprot:EST42175.1 Hypothetical protein SS50377_18481 [Spironucleus salmonicida]
MTYLQLIPEEIPKLFPKLNQVIQMRDLASQFTYLIDQKEIYKIQTFCKQSFTDILLDILKEDEFFISQAKVTHPEAAKKFLFNYYIINYSPYVKLKTVQVLEQYASSFKNEIILDMKLKQTEIQQYYRFLKVHFEGAVPVMDIAKTLFTLQFWLYLFEWIGLQNHLHQVVQKYQQDSLLKGQVSTETQTKNYTPNDFNIEQNIQYQVQTDEMQQETSNYEQNFNKNIQQIDQELNQTMGLNILTADFDWIE